MSILTFLPKLKNSNEVLLFLTWVKAVDMTNNYHYKLLSHYLLYTDPLTNYLRLDSDSRTLELYLRTPVQNSYTGPGPTHTSHHNHHAHYSFSFTVSAIYGLQCRHCRPLDITIIYSLAILWEKYNIILWPNINFQLEQMPNIWEGSHRMEISM